MKPFDALRPVLVATFATLLMVGAPTDASGQPETRSTELPLTLTPATTPYLTPLGPAITPAGSVLPPALRPAAPGISPTGPIPGRLVLTPSLTVNGEFNDNITQNNRDRESDFILSFVPGLTLTFTQPSYTIAAGYSFSALMYLDHSELNDAMGRQNFSLSASYRPTPRLTLSATDVFTIDENSNIASIDGFSTGRVETTSNALSLTASYQLTELTTVRATGAWTLQRFSSADEETSATTALASDTYTVSVGADRRLTPRLTGNATYEFAYFDVESDAPTTAHTLRVGVTYLFTPTLTGSISGGPQVVRSENETTVTPSIQADLTQIFWWGTASLNYSRSESTTSGVGGTGTRDSLAGSVNVTTLARQLAFGLTGLYSRGESRGTTRGRGSDVELQSFTVSLQASYRLTTWLSAVGAYSYFIQRTDGAGGLDVDQNRVFLGLQVAYPLRFD